MPCALLLIAAGGCAMDATQSENSAELEQDLGATPQVTGPIADPSGP
jgi:hypothetical protein